MKKLWACAVLLASTAGQAASEEASSFAVGMGVDQGLSVVMQFDKKMNLAVGNDGVAFDYLLKTGSFEGDVPFTWYVGAGGRIGWDKDSGDFGARVPLGLNWNFVSDWNAYAQFQPELNYRDKSDDIKLDLGAAMGIRYAF